MPRRKRQLPSRFAMVDPATLKANPRNPRRMSTEGMGKLRRVIREVGFSSPVVVQESSGMLIAGHQRTAAAVAERVREIPALFLDVSDEVAQQLLLADNRLGEEAEWNEATLAEILAEMGAEGAGLVGFSDEEFERTMRQLEEQVGSGRPMMRRKRIDWDRFTVFHACVGDQLFAMDRIHYLASFGHSRGTVPPKPPNSLFFVDSGLLQGAEREGRRYLERQPEVVRWAEGAGADWVAMMDIPRFPGILEDLQYTPKQAYDRQLRLAREFARLDTTVERKVFILQGPTFEEYERCARDYAELVRPQDVVALGGVKLRSREVDWVSELTAMTRGVFPVQRIHLFGIAYPPTVARAVQHGATSCDSASAASIHWNNVLVPVKRGDHYGVKRLKFTDLLEGENVSIGGKLFPTLTAWNMVQGTAAILMSAVAEEMAILLEAGVITEEQVPIPIEEEEPELEEELV